MVVLEEMFYILVYIILICSLRDLHIEINGQVLRIARVDSTIITTWGLPDQLTASNALYTVLVLCFLGSKTLPQTLT